MMYEFMILIVAVLVGFVGSMAANSLFLLIETAIEKMPEKKFLLSLIIFAISCLAFVILLIYLVTIIF